MIESTPKIWAILPAAGAGKRFSNEKPKQFFQLNGQPVAEHSLGRLLTVSQLEQIIVPSDIDCSGWSQIPSLSHTKVKQVNGGEHRANSVLNGLLSISESAAEDDWVLVHDIARPCITSEDIQKLITAVKAHPVGGILTATVNETLKKVNSDQHIKATENRAEFRLAQTPQLFKYGLLKQAIERCLQADIIPTDEAFAIERAGLSVLSVKGRHDNIKITHKEDLAIASAILKSQES